MFSKLIVAVTSILREYIIGLPDEYSRIRVFYYNKMGCSIAKGVSLSPNVRFRGLVSIGVRSSVAQNVTISGGRAGVFIGNDVMIAPNVVIVAFDHGFSLLTTPMKNQKSSEAAVHIENDVWVGANVTIGKGVRIGEGVIIGANSYLNKDVPPYSIVAGVPARVIKVRQADE